MVYRKKLSYANETTMLMRQKNIRAMWAQKYSEASRSPMNLQISMPDIPIRKAIKVCTTGVARLRTKVNVMAIHRSA